VHGVTTITQVGEDPDKLMPVPGGNGGRVALAYDPAGRVAQLTRTTGAGADAKSVGDWYAYDDLGNPIAQTTAVPAADPVPPDAPTTGDRTLTEGAFDIDGIRVMRRVTVVAGKKSSTVTTVFLGDTEVTFDNDTLQRTLTRSHTTPGGVPVASEEVVTAKGKAPGTAAWTWLVADQQHSIRLAKGPDGVKRTAYLPHGTPLGYGNNPDLAPGGRGYLNKTHDPNGDIRLDHRAYQPGLNVLTTPDALLTPYDPQGLNPYAYARNNPIGLSDPSGLKPADLVTGDPLATEDVVPYVASSSPGPSAGNGAAGAASGTIYAPLVDRLAQSNQLDKLSFAQLDMMATLLEPSEAFVWDDMPICWGQGQCSLAADHAQRHPSDYEGILTVGLSNCGPACQDAESIRALGTFLLSLAYGGGGARYSMGARASAAEVAGPSVRYNRAQHYGGAQTNSPAGQALREAAEGTACPSCGKPQISGTNTAPVPEHSPPLLQHYYDHGGYAMTDAQRRVYARSADAFDGTMCLTCQRAQGGLMSRLSRWYAALWGLG
jgi:RHS repeat-associated protein